MATALFQGSFDPFTTGHADIVDRALTFFNRIVVAVMFNVRKQGLLTPEERKELIERVYRDEPRVSVVVSDKLTIELASQLNVDCLLRSVRNVQDYEYEQVMAAANRELGGPDTLLLFSRPELAHVSSSLVRELHHFGRDVTPYLPAGITLPARLLPTP